MAMFRFRNPDNQPMFGTVRRDMEAAFLEFCGTFLFLLLGLGGIQAAAMSNAASLGNASQNSQTGSSPAINTVASIDQLMFISASMGLSLLISMWLFYRATGGIFNPNVTTALLFAGIIGPVRWALCCAAQLLGAIAAAGVLLALLPGPLVVNTSPGTGINRTQAVFIEMFLTAALVLAVLMLAAEKHRATPFAPIGVGLTLFAGHLFGVIFTGAAMNTARAFGPAVVTGFQRRHWVYWLGPFLGSLLGVAFYAILRRLKYWTVNPDQDTWDSRQSPDGPFDNARGTHHRGDSLNNLGVDPRHSTTTAATHPLDPTGEKAGRSPVNRPGHIV
ncbi:Aquaporin-4 [Tulasnella sp. 418]|nr:Aquaporin-4 [Tulasnella sp. 418]